MDNNQFWAFLVVGFLLGGVLGATVVSVAKSGPVGGLTMENGGGSSSGKLGSPGKWVDNPQSLDEKVVSNFGMCMSGCEDGAGGDAAVCANHCESTALTPEGYKYDGSNGEIYKVSDNNKRKVVGTLKTGRMGAQGQPY